MNETKIEWTNATWNPVSGCTEVSPGCDNCYARVRAERMRGTIGFPKGFDPTEKPHKLGEPLTGRAEGLRFFVNSMSDLFHREFSNEYIAAVFGVMATAHATKKHTFQVLTKRPHRAAAWFAWLEQHWNSAWDKYEAEGGEAPLRHIGPGSDDKEPPTRHTPGWQQIVCAKFAQLYLLNAGKKSPAWDCGLHAMLRTGKHTAWPLPNVWIGTSIENAQVGPSRLDALRQVPAAVRFLSCEPLLGPLTGLDFTGVDWVIVGGESGKGSRPMELAWVEEVIAMARAVGAAVFVKQLGSVWAGSVVKKGGNPDEWPAHLRVREFPSAQPLETLQEAPL